MHLQRFARIRGLEDWELGDRSLIKPYCANGCGGLLLSNRACGERLSKLNLRSWRKGVGRMSP